MIVETEVAQLLGALLCTVRRRVERETGRLPTKGEAFGIICVHVLRAWGADPASESRLPRAHRVFARDGWRCVVPSCTAQKNLHAHHIVPRSAGGGNEPENLATLCAYHHLRGVHGGRIEVSGRAPGELRVSLGLRAGLVPLVVYINGSVSEAVAWGRARLSEAARSGNKLGSCPGLSGERLSQPRQSRPRTSGQAPAALESRLGSEARNASN